MATIVISFPATPFTDHKAIAALQRLGFTSFTVKENEDRVEKIKNNVVLGKNMQWGDTTDTTLAVNFTGAFPKGVEIDLNALQERDVIEKWEKQGK